MPMSATSHLFSAGVCGSNRAYKRLPESGRLEGYAESSIKVPNASPSHENDCCGEGLLRTEAETGISEALFRELETDALARISRLAIMYSDRGLLEEAVKLQETGLGIRMRMCGDDLSIATAMETLVMMYWDQGRWTESTTLQEKIVEVRTKILGRQDLSTVLSVVALEMMKRNGELLSGVLAQEEELSKLKDHLRRSGLLDDSFEIFRSHTSTRKC